MKKLLTLGLVAAILFPTQSQATEPWEYDYPAYVSLYKLKHCGKLSEQDEAGLQSTIDGMGWDGMFAIWNRMQALVDEQYPNMGKKKFCAHVKSNYLNKFED